MSKRYEMRQQEMAMRALLLVKSLARGETFCIFDLANAIRDRFEVSRATSYRVARLALDVLGIDYSTNDVRKARQLARVGSDVKRYLGPASVFNGGVHA